MAAEMEFYKFTSGALPRQKGNRLDMAWKAEISISDDDQPHPAVNYSRDEVYIWLRAHIQMVQIPTFWRNGSKVWARQPR